MDTFLMPNVLSFDTRLFLAINHLPHTRLTDAFAMTLSGIEQWGFIWIVFAVILFIREEERDAWFFLPTVVSIGLSALLSDFLFKSVVGRLRPSMDMGAIVITNPGNYSFPSTHATLAFSLAYVLSYAEPKKRFWFYLLAVGISMSRVYLGVHFPVDIIAGAVLGTCIGYVALRCEQFFAPRKKVRKKIRS